MPVSFEMAQSIMQRHHQECRRLPGAADAFEALAISTRNGDVIAAWERLPLTSRAISDWLGY